MELPAAERRALTSHGIARLLRERNRDAARSTDSDRRALRDAGFTEEDIAALSDQEIMSLRQDNP
jgi:hypothetical protein